MRTIKEKLFVLCVATCSIVPLLVFASPRASMPKEMRGTWDVGRKSCSIHPSVESDARIDILEKSILGFENNDQVRSVKMISREPLAWRIVRISDIAPEEIQGFGEIFVLSKDRLTITDGESARTYTRCE